MSRKVVPIRRPSPSRPEWSDEAVATACSSGDPAAVAELFERFHPTVTRFLSRMVGQGPDVEDLLQSTFLQVARGPAPFEGSSTVTTWLLGIAANVVRHWRRSHGRRKRMLEALGTVPLPSSGDTAGQADARRRLARMSAALDALPLERRLAFVLCELEGMSAREAAQVLNTTETAVWKRVSVARRALRRALEVST